MVSPLRRRAHFNDPELSLHRTRNRRIRQRRLFIPIQILDILTTQQNDSPVDLSSYGISYSPPPMIPPIHEGPFQANLPPSGPWINPSLLIAFSQDPEPYDPTPHLNQEDPFQENRRDKTRCSGFPP